MKLEEPIEPIFDVKRLGFVNHIRHFLDPTYFPLEGWNKEYLIKKLEEEENGKRVQERSRQSHDVSEETPVIPRQEFSGSHPA